MSLSCSHTGYTLTLVWTVDLLPARLGRLHILLDILGHALAAILLPSLLAALAAAWHVAKFCAGLQGWEPGFL